MSCVVLQQARAVVVDSGECGVAPCLPASTAGKSRRAEPASADFEEQTQTVEVANDGEEAGHQEKESSTR